MIEPLARGVYVINDFFSADECRRWITESEAAGYDAAPITTRHGPRLAPEVRNNRRVMRDDPELAEQLWASLRRHLPPFLDGRQAIGINERFRFYRYEPGEYFAGHVDGIYRRYNGEESRLTLMIYLNEDFSGGETSFDDVTVTPRTGMALVFRHELFHEGRPLHGGTKYVLRSDVMFAPVGQARG